MSTEIHCIIPQLNVLLRHELASKILRPYFARATVKGSEAQDEAALLFSLFTVPWEIAPPVASVTGLADGLATAQDYWLRADPLYLKADITTLHYHSDEQPTAQSIALNTLQSVIVQLQALLQPWKMCLHTPCAYRWYLSMPFQPTIKSIAPNTLQDAITPEMILDLFQMNRPLSKPEFCPNSRRLTDEERRLLGVNKYRSQSNNEAVGQKTPFRERSNIAGETVPWQRLFTEIQMVLHAAQLPFNTLWFWGGGCLPILSEVSVARSARLLKSTTYWQSIWADHPLVHGLAQLQGYGVESLLSLSDCYETICSPGRHLLMLSTQQAIANTVLLQKLFQAVKRSHIRRLWLYDARGRVYCLTPYLIRRFWRRGISL